jgi:hypothetical protein
MHADRPWPHRVLDALPSWSARARVLCLAIMTFYLGLLLGLLMAPRPETAREMETLQHHRAELEARAPPRRAPPAPTAAPAPGRD